MMFEFMFGWRKASKCKKLIKKVQYNLDVLKKKKSCIVRQLRNDVAQLIRNCHYQIAFNRVDQIYRDECIVGVYELLDLYCEIISLQLSYIRRNKDCPEDINEAISSLIFASARCKNLPELLQIRKLFSERYGERFESTALELLPGNFVNAQIIENLSIKNVPNEVKYKLVEEISASLDQNASLAFEVASEKHQQATNNNASFPATGTEQIASSPTRSHFGHPGVDDSGPSIPDPKSSTKNPTVNAPEEITYLDDIHIAEFRSPLHSAKTGSDQRLFIFRPSVMVYGSNDFNIEHSEPLINEKKVRRRSRKLGDMGICRDYDYRRAVSMPCKRSTKCVDENGVKRSNSLPVEPSPPHVHPKLPDYDELAAVFTAMKKEHLQKRK